MLVNKVITAINSVNSTAMSNVLAIFRREVTTQFSSALAGVVIPVFLIFVGVFSLFFQDVFIIGVAEMRSIFFWMGLFYLLLVPAITMRAFAEEKRIRMLFSRAGA